MQGEQAAEIPYFQAHAAAEKEAVAEAYGDGNDTGVAEIKAMSPNYPPAQLLYAFAIENVLTGLIVVNTPGLIEERRLNDELTPRTTSSNSPKRRSSPSMCRNGRCSKLFRSSRYGLAAI